MRWWRLVVGAPFALFSGCSWLIDTGDLSGPVVDSASGEDAAVVDASPVDGPLGEDAGSDGTASGCPGIHGPAMVRVLGYCIDATEVTNAQYEEFLAAKAGDTSGQPTICTWNNSYAPNFGWPPLGSEVSFPVAGVDWCDATMFCQWAGKRLCGRISGGSLDSASGNVAGESQWFTACSHNGDGLHAYPYGNTYDASSCSNTNARAPVATHAGCVGGYPGIFDMSGNVAEWEDLCDPADGGPTAATACRARGGGQNESAIVMSCPSSFTARRDYTIAGIGIRCCAP